MAVKSAHRSRVVKAFREFMADQGLRCTHISDGEEIEDGFIMALFGALTVASKQGSGSHGEARRRTRAV